MILEERDYHVTTGRLAELVAPHPELGHQRWSEP